MPYRMIDELPAPVRQVLPDNAQHIYMEAYNSAWDEYKDPDDRYTNSDRETTAHRVAWSAVKRVYERGADDNWRPK